MRTFAKTVLLFISLSLLAGALYLFLSKEYGAKFTQFFKTKNIKAQKQVKDIKLTKPISILVLGADSLIPGKLGGWNGRSDFMALVYINPSTDEVSILSIPRDTYVNLKNYKVYRINSANQIGGYKLAIRAVKKLLNIKEIDHVVVFSIKAVSDLLDDIGPLKIFVPKRMSYHDQSASLHIDFQPGLQSLNGKQLINFLRYRDAINGDIGRIRRQHMFFRALIKRILEPQMIFRVPSLIKKANRAILSDMNFAEMFRLGTLIRSLPPKSIKSYIVPGDFGKDGSWQVDYPQLEQLMAKILETKENNHGSDLGKQ